MDSSNSLVLNFAFPCGLRGFHVYKELWNPKLNEKLETIHEENNPHDRYAVAAIRKTVSRLRPVVVGHLPREISRFTRFIILHGATVKVKVSDTKYRRSPLIQGGLEIPVEVEVQMETPSKTGLTFSFQLNIFDNFFRQTTTTCWSIWRNLPGLIGVVRILMASKRIDFVKRCKYEWGQHEAEDMTLYLQF